MLTVNLDIAEQKLLRLQSKFYRSEKETQIEGKNKYILLYLFVVHDTANIGAKHWGNTQRTSTFGFSSSVLSSLVHSSLVISSLMLS